MEAEQRAKPTDHPPAPDSRSDPVQAPRLALAGEVPDDQKALLAAVERGRATYQAGENDMAKGAARPARAREMCLALTRPSVTNWLGKVATLSSNSDGK